MPLPVGTKTHPALQLLQWVRDPLGVMERNAAEFGGMFTMRWAGLKTIVMVSDPEALQVTLTSPCLVAPGESNEIARPLVGDRSVILMSGEQHQRRRKLLMAIALSAMAKPLLILPTKFSPKLASNKFLMFAKQCRTSRCG